MLTFDQRPGCHDLYSVSDKHIGYRYMYLYLYNVIFNQNAYSNTLNELKIQADLNFVSRFYQNLDYSREFYN